MAVDKFSMFINYNVELLSLACGFLPVVMGAKYVGLTFIAPAFRTLPELQHGQTGAADRHPLLLSPQTDPTPSLLKDLRMLDP